MRPVRQEPESLARALTPSFHWLVTLCVRCPAPDCVWCSAPAVNPILTTMFRTPFPFDTIRRIAGLGAHSFPTGTADKSLRKGFRKLCWAG